MDKSKLKQTMIEMERHSIEDVTNSHNDFFNESQVDWEQVVDADDQSHFREQTEISNELDRQIIEHEEHLLALANISFDESDIVEPGAIVTVSGRHMIVAVSKPRFQFEGQDFIGISADAPIYPAMEGKKAGDVFTFKGRKFKIESVL